jgi:predicted phosphodiesterase
MTPNPHDAPENIPGDRSVIVVSDHHLGLSGQDNVGRHFADFLRYVRTLRPRGDPEGGRTVLVDGRERELYSPEKVILLGDIVDFESPRKNSRASVLADCAPVFPALASLPAEIVYVTGNHDDEISDMAGDYHDILPRNLTIARRHYPEYGHTTRGSRKYTGISIGEKRYFFMHGQQFDLLFKTVGIFQDYPSWVAKNYQLFRDNPYLVWFFRALLVLTLASVLFSFTTPLGSVVPVLLGISLVIVVFSIEPLMLRGFWDSINRRKKTRTDTIETIVEQGFWKHEAGANVLADVIVFGHTHIADDSKGRYQEKYHKRFINSGAWGDVKTRTRDGSAESETNTFVYIDSENALLFYWPVKGRVPTGGRRPVHIPVTLTGDEKAKVSIVIPWIRKHFFTGG